MAEPTSRIRTTTARGTFGRWVAPAGLAQAASEIRGRAGTSWAWAISTTTACL